jgi:POT family proton-dependent oligopeptide transporter
MQLVNPALVMALIPLTTGVLYPAMRRAGIEPTPLRRMTWGLFFGAASYVVAGLLQIPIEAGERLNILWQLAPYLLLTVGEILVSTTGLEFAYSQAPPTMKAALMSMWNLTVAAANLAVALASALNVFSGVGQFFFYAGMAALAGVAMARVARTYVPVDYYTAAR